MPSELLLLPPATKCCTKCGIEKPLELFRKKATSVGSARHNVGVPITNYMRWRKQNTGMPITKSVIRLTKR